MDFTHTEVWGFEHALRGMRNPLNSWEKSDSYCDELGNCIIGENDMGLATRLIKGGSEHRKFLRQIIVSVDITAPLFYWKEFDTYKVGTTANSTSTMHKLLSKPIDKDCFEMDDFADLPLKEYQTVESVLENSLLPFLEQLRQLSISAAEHDLAYSNKAYWKELVRWLPESWLQTRTITMNYENVLNMYHQRKNHKLKEWHTFCDWALEELPYFVEFAQAAGESVEFTK